MTHIEAHAAIDHPAKDRYLWQARHDNPDRGQRDAARMTLRRLAGAVPPVAKPAPPPTPEDLALRAEVAKSGGCCGH